MNTYPKVLVVGPAAGLGGIAAVIRLHSAMKLWKLAGCRILSTYDERSSINKLLAMLKAYAVAPFLISQSSLVHIHVAAQHSMLRKLPIAIMAKLLRRPYIVHLHAASESSVFELTPQWIVRLMFLLSYRVIVLSDSWARIVKKHIPEARTTVMHNPVLRHKANKPVRLLVPVVLFAGKLEDRKGYLDLLDAAVEVLKQRPEVQFCFAGHGELERAQAYATSLSINCSVSFAGWVHPHEMENYYRTATIFCLPSYDEGVPMAVLEAMSYSLPVVCTPVGGLPDLISDGHDALFAEPGNAMSIANQLLTLLNDQEHAASIGISAARTIERKCKIERVEQQLAELYQEINEEWIERRRGLREAPSTV